MPNKTPPKIRDVFGFIDDGLRVYTVVSVPDDDGDFQAELSENDPDFDPLILNIKAFNINRMPDGWENYGDTSLTPAETEQLYTDPRPFWVAMIAALFIYKLVTMKKY